VARVADARAGDDPEALAADEAVWSQLRVLPVRQRAALFLRYHEDLSEAQTAELMGCSVGTVKRQVFVALGKLRNNPGLGLSLGEDEGVAR
jgi:RNA polymerase sigma factor (sigma-70 family)